MDPCLIANPTKPTQLPLDTRLHQASRAADFMALHPDGVTARQLNEACDVGSVTKLISVMRKEMGYSIRVARTNITCNGDAYTRRVALYILVSRPTQMQNSLF